MPTNTHLKNIRVHITAYFRYTEFYYLNVPNYVNVCAGFRLNNANGTVLRPFLQPESLLSSQEFGLRLQVQALGFELMTPVLGVECSSPSAIHYVTVLMPNYLLMPSLMLPNFSDAQSH